MRAFRPLRAGAAIAAALAVTVLAGACDTSPVAASVNGTEIKQTALDQQVRLETDNKAFVDAVDRQSSSSGGQTITGDAPGALSATFVAEVLSTLIGAEAVHQHLAAIGETPSPAALAAARSVEEAAFGSLWLSFPAPFRDTQVQQEAEHTLIEAPLSAQAQSQLQQVYAQVRKYFFAQVCVRTLAVTGSLATAQAITQRTNLVAADPSLAPSLGTLQGGQVTCYDGAGLEAQGSALFDQVLALAPGYASAPIAEPFGYQIDQVTTRVEQAYGPTVAAALALIVSEARGSQDPAYQRILAAAHVSVDPQYGSWEASRAQVVPSSPLGANSTASGAPASP